MAQTTPLRRFGDLDDFAGAAILPAPDAGLSMTGPTIVVEGAVTISGGVLG